jgi:lipoprotein-anchoring transpeptidase ErfK/SrfK
MRRYDGGGLRRAVLAVALVVGGAGTSFGAPGASEVEQVKAGMSWQIGLERAGFSPGLVDGKTGPKTVLATREFQRARGLAVTGRLDEQTVAALNPPAEVLGVYTVTEGDRQLVTGVPKDWNEKAAMRYLGYAALAEVVCERFHTSRKCLEWLNPSLNFDQLKPGDQVVVPAVQEPGDLGRVARLEVNLVEKAVRAYDKGDRLIALFHCSIAQDVSKRPTGSARVVVVQPNPAYTFDPKMWPEVKNVSKKLLIPPGPRNPVGMCWVGLSLPGYGIHGTPAPEMIGKTGSHGCFRLTNWDAVRLGRITTAGVPVKFVNSAGTAVADATPVAPAAGVPRNLAMATTAAPPAAAGGGEESVLKNIPWDQLLMGAMAATPEQNERRVVEDSR